jgi:ribonuclease P protein component
MLPRAQRLSTVEFARVFENGRVLRHPLLQVRVLRRDDGKETLRAAFVAPRKSGKATVRNRLRRGVRERYRLLQSDYSSSIAPCDLVFIIGAAAHSASTSELDCALHELLKRAAGHLKKSGEKPG